MSTRRPMTVAELGAWCDRALAAGHGELQVDICSQPSAGSSVQWRAALEGALVWDSDAPGAAGERGKTYAELIGWPLDTVAPVGP